MDALSCTSGMYRRAKTDMGVPWLWVQVYYDCGYRRITTAAMGILRLRLQAMCGCTMLTFLLRIPYLFVTPLSFLVH